MTSVNTTASIRSGNSAGDPVIRTIATTRPSTSTIASTITNSFTSSQNARRIPGKLAVNWSHEKKVCWTSSQPGLVRMSAASPPSTTTLETAAITVPRRACRRRAASRATRRSAGVLTGPAVAPLPLLELGRLGPDPLVGDLLELAGALQRVDRVGDAGGQRGALLEHGAPVVGALGAELADDLGSLDLGVAEVDDGREVRHDRVDLAVLQRADDVGGRVVHPRLLARRDLLVHGVEAGGAHLHADLGVLQVGERRGRREAGVAGHQHALRGRVVRRREVRALLALRADR